MTAIRYSALTGGFYHIGIHSRLPHDVVAVSVATHARLMRAQAAGGRIVPRNGRPAIARASEDAIGLQHAAARAQIDNEARKRIIAIASLEQQSNDNAALAIAALAGELSEEASAALDRRTRINAVRAASNALEAQLATLSSDQLVDFDATGDLLWESPS